MTPEKLARIQTHLRNEAAGSHPQEVRDAVLWGLLEDALEPSPGTSDSRSLSQSAVSESSMPSAQRLTNHVPGRDVFLTEKMSSPQAPGVVVTDDRAPGGDDPVCLFGPGGDFQTPWPRLALIPPPCDTPGARSDARAPGGGVT